MGGTVAIRHGDHVRRTGRLVGAWWREDHKRESVANGQPMAYDAQVITEQGVNTSGCFLTNYDRFARLRPGPTPLVGLPPVPATDRGGFAEVIAAQVPRSAVCDRMHVPYIRPLLIV